MNKLSYILKLAELFQEKAKQALIIAKYAGPEDYYSKYDNYGDDEPEENAGATYHSGNGEEEEIKNPPYFEDLMDISHKVDDPGLAVQLSALAELYRKAVLIGGGYCSIARAITNLKNMYSDGKDSDIEFILNGITNQLSKLAGGTAALAGQDNPRFVQQLQQLKQDIEARSRPEQTELENAYNEDVGEPGAEDLEGLSEGGESVFDPTAGIGGGKDGPAVNRGWHTTGRAGGFKDWVQYYTQEMQAYQADLAQEKNSITAENLRKLIALLGELIPKTVAAIKLQNDLKVAPDANEQAKLVSMQQELSNLKKTKSILKNKIKSSQLHKEKQRLESEMNSTRDVRIKELLKQRIALTELSSSPDYKKSKERNARLALIRSMSGGNFPGAETYKEMLFRIEEASKLKQTPEQYKQMWRAKTQETDKIKQHFDKNVEEGKRKRGKPITFDGLIIDLQQKIATQKIVIKQKIEKEELSYFRPYKLKIDEAKNDPEALSMAIKELTNAVNSYPLLVAYSESAVKFYKFRDNVKLINKTGILENPAQIPDPIKNQIHAVLEEGNALITSYNGKQFYATVVAAVGALIKYIKDIVGQPASSQNISTGGNMDSNKRKLSIVNITKEAKLQKIAEDVEAEIDNNDAGTENPGEFSHKIFQSILNKIMEDLGE